MSGAERIAAERKRQMEAEGWTPEHDSGHIHWELLLAASSYLEYQIAEGFCFNTKPPHDWPWEADWWKPSDDPIRNLEKAGALIAAEIDRLERLKG